MSDNGTRYQQGRWTREQYECLICRLCNWPLYPPAQLDCCGQRICEQCIPFIKSTEFKCSSCSASGVNANRDKGYMREVENLLVNCPECGDSWVGSISNLRNHLKRHCTLKCKSCNEEFMLTIQLETHRRERCMHRVVPCQLACLGCSNEVPHSEIEKHYLDIEHQKYLLVPIKERLLHLYHGIGKSASQNTTNEQYQHILVDSLSRIDTLAQEIHSINNDFTQVNSKRQMIEEKTMEIREQLVKLNEASIRNMKLLENIHKMIIEMNQLISEIQSTSVNGPNLIDADDTFTWKVNPLVLFNNDSVTMHSGPFQCSQWGYRMQVSMALQKDAQSLCQFLMMSFVLLRGQYDAILHWPFSYPVTLCLVDLARAQHHLIHSIRPDSQAAVFGRPLNNANTPYHVSRFCQFDKLVENGSNYVRDGHMLVKIHIDFTGTGVHPFQMKESVKSSMS